MSLIDEALKRAQAQHQEKQEEAARPWTPTPLPDRRRIVRSRARWIVAASLVAAAALTGALLLRQAKARNAAAISPASAAVRASSSAAGLPPITSEVTVAPPQAGVPSFAPDGPRGPAAVAPISPSPRGRPAAPPPMSFAPAPEAPTRQARAASRMEKTQESTEAATYAGEMPVPGSGRISLEGIVYSEANPVAVLNGKVIAVGGYIEGFTVVTILPDRVELEAEGKKVVLKLR